MTILVQELKAENAILREQVERLCREVAELRADLAIKSVAGEPVQVDARLLELYQAPFRFDERGGYIWDAQNNMVADNHVEGDQAMRVRGWGRLSYRQDGEEVQDLMGRAMADALNSLWNASAKEQP